MFGSEAVLHADFELLSGTMCTRTNAAGKYGIRNEAECSRFATNRGSAEVLQSVLYYCTVLTTIKKCQNGSCKPYPLIL